MSLRSPAPPLSVSPSHFPFCFYKNRGTPDEKKKKIRKIIAWKENWVLLLLATLWFHRRIPPPPRPAAAHFLSSPCFCRTPKRQPILSLSFHSVLGVDTGHSNQKKQYFDTNGRASKGGRERDKNKDDTLTYFEMIFEILRIEKRYFSVMSN